MRGRFALAGAGVLAGAYGGWLLLDRGWSNLVAAGVWLAGGVIVHDFVLAPLVIALVALLTPVAPARHRAVIAGGAVVLTTVTVVAIPVLGRFGAREDNPTLLDRHYLAGWLVFAVVVVAGVALLSIATGRRRSRATR